MTRDPQGSRRTPDLALFSDLIGQEFLEFILDRAPKKVAARVGKSLDHFDKATRLEGVDEEMGALRLIAAEEELVVAIFEWLKLNTDKVPEHGDFIRKFRNHPVKLAFYPVLSQFRFVLGDMFSKGMTLEGLEEAINWNVKPILADQRVRLQICDENGKEVTKLNPLAVAVSREDMTNEEVVEELFRDFAELANTNLQMTVREFVTARAEYRNKLLYSEDAGFAEMDDSLKSLLEIFRATFRDLLWTLAVLLGNEPPIKSWGLVSQFIALYRRVLIEAKLVGKVVTDD